MYKDCQENGERSDLVGPNAPWLHVNAHTVAHRLYLQSAASERSVGLFFRRGTMRGAGSRRQALAGSGRLVRGARGR